MSGYELPQQPPLPFEEGIDGSGFYELRLPTVGSNNLTEIDIEPLSTVRARGPDYAAMYAQLIVQMTAAGPLDAYQLL